MLIFSAAFPMFSNVDEPLHWDLVTKYSTGHMPTTLERYSPEAIKVLAWHLTPEYLTTQEKYDEGFVQPPLKDLPPEIAAEIAGRVSAGYAVSRNNQESTQPPVYYAAAGAWYRLGELFGIHDIRLAYWIRFLNVLIYGLLVWTAYAFIRRLYPGNLLLRTGVPLLLALLPPGCFLQHQQRRDDAASIRRGVLLAALDRSGREQDSRPISGRRALDRRRDPGQDGQRYDPCADGARDIWPCFAKRAPEGRLRETLRLIGLMVGAAILPIAVWMARNYIGSGDLTGASKKSAPSPWASRPLVRSSIIRCSDPAGAWTFISGLIVTFWRGELVWHLVRMAMRSADIFYIASTLLFATATVVGLIWRREEKPAGERYASGMGVSVLAPRTPWD